MKIIILSLVVFFNVNNIIALSLCDSLEKLKHLTYGFKPRYLSDSLKKHKSQEMDFFWQTARKNPSEAAECLKKMIDNEVNDSFFCFDAASLLLRLDTTEKYLYSVNKGINKCELEDLQLYPYLQICLYLGRKNHDISNLVSKFLDLTEGKIFLSNHFLELGIIDASIFMLNTMNLETAESILINKISNNNYKVKNNAIFLLNLLSTNKGDSVINELIYNKKIDDVSIQSIEQINKKLEIQFSKGTYNYNNVVEFLNYVPYNFEKKFYGFAGNTDLINSACTNLTLNDLNKLYEARKKATFSLSDEALYEYYAITSIIKTIKKNSKNK